MRLSALALIAAVSCTSAAAAPDPKLDLTAFFTGKTHAENVLKIAFRHAVPLRVDSIGGKGDKGDFVLIDTVHEGDKPARTRKWIMREVAPGRYTGSLSDATSPVNIAVVGNTALVQYVMKGGLRVSQRMELVGDGKTLTNRVVVRKLGMKFASVEGKIRKVD